MDVRYIKDRPESVLKYIQDRDGIQHSGSDQMDAQK